MTSVKTVLDEDFNTIQFEKKLTALKDSQEHINALCKWCLDNRKFHKKIVVSWLNVLKRVKIEQRLNLFYLANDVIQYSKRRHLEFVDSWGTALQKATTLVRDVKVKHKIIRIFNIWEQRGVYNEEFIADLCGLISVVPSASKHDEPHEFQANYVIGKIKQCSKLETDTDNKLKMMKEHNPKIPFDLDSLCSSLKERAHVDDVEKELSTYVKQLESYVNALKAEIKCRIANISVLKQASTHLEKDKRDVKVIANAYRTFGQRLNEFQKVLRERQKNLPSPIPSPDIDAPSPGPDCDIELPGEEPSIKNNQIMYNVESTTTLNTSIGYYNPLPSSTDNSINETPDFNTNGFSSFIGSNLNLSDLSTASLFANDTITNSTTNQQHLPLQPPPMPTFAGKDAFDVVYSSDTFGGQGGFDATDLGQSSGNQLFNTSDFSNTSYKASIDPSRYNNNRNSEEYNPEHDLESWNNSWTAQNMATFETPISPPHFEKIGNYSQSQPIEYHDTNTSGPSITMLDIDDRILSNVMQSVIDKSRSRGKDVDHRNLISLTGSPNDTTNYSQTTSNPMYQPHPPGDQDYRLLHTQPPPPPPLPPPSLSTDQDYRVPPFNLEQLKLPPPPPPPQDSPETKQPSITDENDIFDENPSQIQLPQMPPLPSTNKSSDSVDMDLSEDDSDTAATSIIKPPPPLPDLPMDMGSSTNQYASKEQSDNYNYSYDTTKFYQNSQSFYANCNEMSTALQQVNSMNGNNYGCPTIPPFPPPPLNGLPPPFLANRGRRGGRGFRGRPPLTPPLQQQQQQSPSAPSSSIFRGASNFRGRGYIRGGNMIRNRRQRGNFMRDSQSNY